MKPLSISTWMVVLFVAGPIFAQEPESLAPMPVAKWTVLITPGRPHPVSVPRAVEFTNGHAVVLPLALPGEVVPPAEGAFPADPPPGAELPDLPEFPADDAAPGEDAPPPPVPQGFPAEIPLAGPLVPGCPPRPSYAEVYCSIPFIRSEYEANPSYRHDATMELLLGQLRPQIVHRPVIAPPPPPLVPPIGLLPPRTWLARFWPLYAHGSWPFW